MIATGQSLCSAASAEIDEEINRENLVEDATHTLIRLSGVIENIATISENIAYTDLSPQLQDRVQIYCRRVLENGYIISLRGTGGHEIRSMIDKNLNILVESSPGRTGHKFQASIRKWQRDVEDMRRLTRDLSNRVFYRRKKKDREREEEAATTHPLVRSWDSLSKTDAVKRISLARMKKFLNRQGNHLEVLLQYTRIQTYPSRITLEPTSACNYRCTMCSQGHYTERPTYFEVDDDTVERALPVLEFVENMATQVMGEPTLSLQLGKIANYATSHGVLIDMITNGSLLHKTNADLSKFSTICISFDGATKEVFEAQRVGSSFDNVMKNIQTARADYPLVEMEFNVCVTRLNISQLADIVRLAADLGVDRVLFNPLNTRDYPHLAPLELGTNNVDDLNKFINEAREAAVGTGVRVFNYITDRTLSSAGAKEPVPVTAILNQLANLDVKNAPLTPEVAAEKFIATQFPFFPEVFDLSPLSIHFSASPEQQSAPEMVTYDTVADIHAELMDEAKQHLGRELKLPYCTAPYKGGIIFANGDYTPCCYMTREASFGTISQNFFETIWNSSGIQEMRRSMFDDSALIPACRNCNGRQRYTFTIELLHLAHRLGYKWEDIKFPKNFNPPAAVKAKIDSIFDDLFAPGSRYTLATLLKFGADGNARPYMSSGFSVSGANGVWNDGFESVLTFYVRDTVFSGLMFEVSLLPFLHSDLLTQQRIEVNVNGQHVETWCLSRPAITKCHISFVESIVGTDGLIQIAFRFPDASSWYHLGVNRSKGARSVMFVEARLFEVSTEVSSE